MASFHVGDVLLGKYKLGATLGKGGMGHVFAAHDGDLDRPVAIKVLPPSLADRPESVGA